MNRRSLLNTSFFVAPALALAACASTLATVGTAIGSGAVAKVVSYVQGALSGLSVLAATFLPTSTQVSSALASLQAFATSIGSNISAGASWLTGSTATQFSGLVSGVLNAMRAGLALLPAGNTLTLAMDILAGIESAIPVAVNFIAGLFSGAASTPATAAMAPQTSVLRFMVP
jgi:hypothetical protein